MPKLSTFFLIAALSSLLSSAQVAFASAQTEAELRSEIATLRAQLAEKEAQLNTLSHINPASEAVTTPQTGAYALSADNAPASTEPRVAPSSTLGWDKALRAANTVRYLVSGSSLMTVMPTGSMKPMFDEHAVLIMEPAPFDELKVGDIITYTHPRHQMPVVHRILEKRGDTFVCKGDNNGRADEVAITRENYRARVFGIIYSRDNASSK